MSRGSIASSICFVAAVALLALAGWNGYQIMAPAVAWKSADATHSNTRVRFRRDGEGILVYQVVSQVTYNSGGQQLTADASSLLESRNYGDIAVLAKKLAASPTMRIYFDPADAKQPRFGVMYSRMMAGEVAGAAVAAVLLLAAGLWLRKKWLPPIACPRCTRPIQRDYRFCPFCRTEVQSA
ncbi:MAG TPA: zinc ribbon domain-containing protein [Bryobacteraceae bacterium]|nr:zinc ribbon domain-containing protein [Bryobacteraceae bacterium]